MKRSLIGVVLALSLITNSAFAQQEEKKPKGGPRRQLATIVFAGLGGAVLGLSTLSFYGRPQEKLANIAMGFALGVIVGTVYVTFQTASHDGGGYIQQEGEPGGMFRFEEPKDLTGSLSISPTVDLEEGAPGLNFSFHF